MGFAGPFGRRSNVPGTGGGPTAGNIGLKTIRPEDRCSVPLTEGQQKGRAQTKKHVSGTVHLFTSHDLSDHYGLSGATVLVSTGALGDTGLKLLSL